MSYGVSYPVVDESLAGFLLLVFAFAICVAVAVGVGGYLGVLEPSTILEQVSRFAIDHAVAE